MKSALSRIKQLEQGRIALAARFIAVTANGLDGRHEPYVITSSARRLGVHHAPLLFGGEKWRLLVYECDKADGHCWVDVGEKARHLDKGGNAAPVIIGARTAGDRIVMRAKQQDFILTRPAAARNFEVQATNSRDLIGKSRDRITLLLPLAPDIFCRRLQRLGTKNVTLADFAG